MLTVRGVSAFDIVKITTFVVLAGLLVILGSATRSTSPFSYVALSAIMLLQILEVLFPPDSTNQLNYQTRLLFFRGSIAGQILFGALLVATTDGSGSIYELVFLLPIISAATKLCGKDVAIVVGCIVLVMSGFILADFQDVPSPLEMKELQDALSAVVYFAMAGLLIHSLAKGERELRMQQENLASDLRKTNEELRLTQRQLSDRLTEKTQMEERLQRITQMATLGEMAGHMAHEIRNPLGIIKGAVDLLAKKTSDPSIRQHIEVLLEEVNHLNTAIEGILRLGRSARIQFKKIDLVSLLQNVKEVSTAWTSPSLSVIHFTIPTNPYQVEGDYDLLFQAFINLVRNGLQAIPIGKSGVLTINIEASPDKKKIMTTITDSGVGLSKEDATRLGEPFFSNRPGGIGLGFSLAKRIIKEHQGSVEVASELGQGTCISIYLPAYLPLAPHKKIDDPPLSSAKVQ